MAMTEDQANALLVYIDARIDEKIADALGRDSLYEAMRVGECLQDLESELEFAQHTLGDR